MAFPTAAATGIKYHHYDLLPRDWASITDVFEYEDGGMDFNRRSSNPPYIWRIVFRPMSASDAQQFDDFWEGVGINETFSFTDKNSVTHTNVRVKEYSRTHEAHKSWEQIVSFTLIKY